MFIRIKDGQQADANRDNLREFLASRGLHIAGGNSDSILDADNKPLTFDGYWTDLTLDPLDQQDLVSGGISHATLSHEECEFIYNLCVAGGFLVINPQGGPTTIVINHNHREEDLFDLDDTLWADSVDEFAQIVGAPFLDFQNWRDRVMQSQTPK